MIRKSLLILFMLAFASLSACQARTPAVEVAATAKVAATTSSAPQPQAGKTTIVGRVLTNSSQAPLANVPVRLADVYREGDSEGAYVLDGAFSPGDITDEQGNFLIENIDAKEYVIVVGDVYEVYKVVQDENGRPKIWQTEVDKLLDVGELRVDLVP